MKKFNLKKKFFSPETLEDLMFGCIKYFHLPPIEGRKVFQKQFLNFYKKRIDKKKKEINFQLNLREKIIFPFIKMGTLDSAGMFAYHEHNVFLFYFLKRFNYKCVADIGANIGLHSILLSKFGYKVDAYEPDPDHLKILNKYLKKNRCKNVVTFNKAIFDSSKTLNFTKVINNPAANHITGEKGIAYGPLKKIKVQSIDINKIIKKYDFVKIDAEGSEGRIIERIKPSQYEKTDFVIEISGIENAKKIFYFCKKNKINIFSHKILWSNVKSIGDMPVHHTEGLIFISKNKKLLDFAK
jgi:FkbM family methyltransferase